MLCQRAATLARASAAAPDIPAPGHCKKAEVLPPFSCAEYLAASTLHSGNRPCFDEQMPNSLHFCIIRFLKSGIPAPAGCPGVPFPGHKEFPASSSVKRLEMTRWHLRGCFLFSMLNDLRFPFFHQVNRSSKIIIFSCILQELPDV